MLICWRLFIFTYILLISTTKWNFRNKMIVPTQHCFSEPYENRSDVLRELYSWKQKWSEVWCFVSDLMAHRLALRTGLFWTLQEIIKVLWKTGEGKAKWKKSTHMLFYPQPHSPIMLGETGTNTSMPNKQPQVSALMTFFSYFKASLLFIEQRQWERSKGSLSTAMSQLSWEFQYPH